MSDYCAKCKREEKEVDSLQIQNRYTTKKGEKKKVMYCRRCNRERRKKYYHNGGKENIKKAIKKYEKNNPLTRRAYGLVSYHKKVGNIKEPNNCEKCGQDRKLQAHHEDYNKPLDIKWLCYSCHADTHK